MRFVLVGPLIEENLAIGYLVAGLRAAGHDALAVSFIDDAQHSATSREILAARPDAIGLSMSFQCRAAGFIAVAEELRALGFRGHLTAGGHFASLAADQLLAEHAAIDSVLCGEADSGIVALADALASNSDLGAIPGIVTRGRDELTRGPRPRKCLALDSLPYPARHGPPRRELGIAVAPLIGSRGCRGRCAYCSIAAFARLADGPVRRERTPADIVAEMAWLWRKRDVRIFVFHDDDFFAGRRDYDLERIDELATKMRAAGLPRVALSIKARPDDVDPQVMARLVDLGLLQVVLGIDNDAPATLRSLDRHLPPHAQRNALHTLRRAQVSVGSNLLLWSPMTTGADLLHNLALMEAFPSQLFNLGRAEPYEGAPLTLRLDRAGELLGSYLGRDYVMADPVAERSWQLFSTALGPRCYPADGVMQRAIRLDWWKHLHRHFRLAESSAAADIDALTTAVAQSTRQWLEEMVGCAHTELAATASPEMHRAIAAEDEQFRLRLSQLMSELIANVTPPPARSFARTRRALSAAGHYAAATCAACTCAACVMQSTPTQKPVPELVAIGDAGAAATDAETTPSATARALAEKVRIMIADLDARVPECGGCSFAMGYHVLSYKVSVVAPEGLEFVRFDIGKGATLAAQTISPNGRRVWAELMPQGLPGEYELGAIFRDANGKQVERSSKFRVTSENDMMCEPGPCSDPPGPMPGGGMTSNQLSPPPALEAVARAGKLVFTRSPAIGTDRLGIPVVDFGVGIADSRPSGPNQTPEIKCSSGSVIAVERGQAAGLRDWFRVTYSPAHPGTQRLRAGARSCSVGYPAPAGAPAGDYHATLTIVIDDDGTARLEP